VNRFARNNAILNSNNQMDSPRKNNNKQVHNQILTEWEVVNQSKDDMKFIRYIDDHNSGQNMCIMSNTIINM